VSTSPSSRRRSAKTRSGRARRRDQGEEGRFRKFTREQVEARGDNLDITWLRDEDATHTDDLPEPEEIAARVTEKVRSASPNGGSVEGTPRLRRRCRVSEPPR